MENQKASWVTIVLISAVPLIMVLGNSMLIPILPKMQSVLHISKFQSSLVITLFSVPAGIVIPLAGLLSDRLGRRAVIAPSLCIYGVGGLIAGAAALWMSKPYWVILAGRTVQGIGAAGTAPIIWALVGDLYKGSARSRILGITETANGLGKVLSPIIGVLVGMIVWYLAFFVFPVLCVPIALGMWFLIKEKKPSNQGQAIKSYLSSVMTVFRREFRWLSVAYLAGAVALFILFGVLFYLSEILESKYKIEGLMKGGILAIPLLAMAITSYITGSKIKKHKKLMKTLIVLGQFVVAGSLGVAAMFENTYVLLALLVLSGIGTGLVLPCLNMLITSAVSQEERGIVTSLYGSVRFLGVAVGPPVFTWLMDTSRMLMFASVAGLAAMSALLCLLFVRISKDNPGNQFQTEKERRAKRSLLARTKARA